MTDKYVRLPLLILCLTTAGTAFAANWPQFRGPDRNGASPEKGLLRAWPEGGPEVLWTTAVAQGYAAPSVYDGRVYFNDYDREARTWLVRCLSLEDGIELWRKSMVAEYGTRISSWYNGQCPLLEPDRLIIAPGGKEALVVALEKRTGNELWRTPNPDGRKLSHVSVMPAVLGGVNQFLYCTLEGPLGISAEDGALLWQLPFKFNVAISPSPLQVDEEHGSDPGAEGRCAQSRRPPPRGAQRFPASSVLADEEPARAIAASRSPVRVRM